MANVKRNTAEEGAHKQVRVRVATWLKLARYRMQAVKNGLPQPTMDEVILKALEALEGRNG